MAQLKPEMTTERQEALLERFLRYVKIDTQSQEGSESYPSTEKQKDLLLLLVDELKALGLEDAVMDDYGYVMATLPSNLPAGKKAPVVGLLAHVDTAPDSPGKDVKPQVIRGYEGGDIPLPGEPNQVLRVSENENLPKVVGHTVITTDGTTLLGADDKAGVAEIMTAVAWLQDHPEFPHGTIRVGFTPDEEIGEGTKHFDIKKFGADLAYTLDGGDLGQVEDETFCADSATVTVTGLEVHPGYAKNKMLNAVRIASEFVTKVAEGPLPETTEGHEGYLHPHHFNGTVTEATIRLLVRDFTNEGLAKLEERLKEIAAELEKSYAGATIAVEIQESYRNMKYHLDKHPQVAEFAIEAVRRAGVEPLRESIRGGTDGARLSAEGLPTPNLFAGGQNFHSVREWVSLEWMSKAVETTLHLVGLYAERA